MNQLGHFEQRLLTELRQVVAEQAAAPSPRRARPRARLALATAGGGLLAAGLLVGLPAMDGAPTSTAYAVVSNEDGTVTVTVKRLEDAEGLERQLEEHGVEAEVDYPPEGMMCRDTPPRFERDNSARTLAAVYREDMSFSIVVNPAHLRGRTMVLEHSGPPEIHNGMIAWQITGKFDVAAGPVAPCELVEEPW